MINIIEMLNSAILNIVWCGLSISVILTIIYLSGMLMNLISDKYKSKEWINSIIACIDIILIGAILIIGMYTLYSIAPIALLFLSGVIVIGITLLVSCYLVDLIKKNFIYRK